MELVCQEIKEKNIVVIKIPERLNTDNSEELNRLIRDKVNEGIYRLVLDMTSTNYVDSTGLGIVISRIAFLRSHDGDIRLAIKSNFVWELLEVTNLHQILKCFDAVEEAVNSFD